MARFEDITRLRQQIAQEAARIISNQGVQDYRRAKLKAAARLNGHGRAALPTNSEIEAALIAHQALFDSREHDSRIRELRLCALIAMRLLNNFSPRLVGPVLAGTAPPGAPVNLHVFSDTPEEVLLFIESAGHSVASYERRLKNRRDQSTQYPGYRFVIKEATVEATVFDYDGLRQAPIGPVDGKPMFRARAAQIEALVDEYTQARDPGDSPD